MKTHLKSYQIPRKSCQKGFQIEHEVIVEGDNREMKGEQLGFAIEMTNKNNAVGEQLLCSFLMNTESTLQCSKTNSLRFNCASIEIWLYFRR